MHILHLANTESNAQLFTGRFVREVKELGSLKIVADGQRLKPEKIIRLMRACDVLLTGWGSVPVPVELADDPGRLRYVCHLTGTVAGIVPIEIVRAGMPVTNWGDAPAYPVAEGALALLLACLKQLPEHLDTKRAGRWHSRKRDWIGSMRGLRLGFYGYGAIGRAFHELCRPLQPCVTVFDPYVAKLPAGTARAKNLETLFENSDAVAIHAALTPGTRHSVTAGLLARLPDGGIVINTARGEIIDQDALFAELKAGRLRAGLDVLAGDDRLPARHPARRWSNLIMTSHEAHVSGWPPDPERLDPWHEVALDNLRRFLRKKPLRYRLTEERLARST